MNAVNESRAEARRRVLAEIPISLETAIALFPAVSPGPLTKRHLLRWILQGKKQVRLDAARIGGEWHTSRQAVDRFLAAVRQAPRRH